MTEKKPVQVIAVSGGKGGVGKTNVSVNLGVALSQLGKKVLLFDADLGLANVDIMLGLRARENLEHVIEGKCTLQDILLEGPKGLKIVPASSGTQVMSELSTVEHANLIQAFEQLEDDLDILIVDTAAGISDSVVSFSRAAHEVIVVVCDEPTSITDAYALMKILSREYGIQRFRVLANMVRTAQEGRELFAKLTVVTDRFLDVNLHFVGSIPFDDKVRKAVRRQKALLEIYSTSPAATAIQNLAERVLEWPLPNGASGQVEFFVERLIASS